MTCAAPLVQVQAAARRRAAAEWVEGLTGIALPTSSDHAFRGALRDGVLLCRILDLLRPGMLAKVGPCVDISQCNTWKGLAVSPSAAI